MMKQEKPIKSKLFGVRLPVEMVEKLDEIAMVEERRRNDVIKRAIKFYLAEYEKRRSEQR